MKKDAVKLKKAILLVGMILTFPFMLLFCLLLVNSINPMQWTFLTRFTVENQSGQDIRITPIGTRGDNGLKERLPIYMIPLPALPAFRTGNYHMKKSQTITIRYDWDDVNFSEIAVETTDGNLYEYIVDPSPLENQYHRPEKNTFIIPDVTAMLPARPQIVEVVQELDYRGIKYIVLLLSTVIYWILWREYKKVRNINLLKPSTDVSA